MKYRIDSRTFESLHKTLKLPTFQRGLVWSNSQKKEFINTLKDGYPFGSILLYEYKNDNKFSLIDGLQRFTTMIDFYENPIDYIEIDEFADQIVDLYPNGSDSVEAKLKNFSEDILLDIIKNKHNSNEEVDLFELSDKVTSEFPVLKNQEREIINVQRDAIAYFENQLDIKNIKIPCIFFEGEENELADVFQRLNRGGKKLSKYQVFAAQWDRYDITLGKGKYSTVILERVIERYEELNNERGILIEDFDPNEMFMNRQINLSELCYGLGFIIAKELPVFFDKITEDICNEIGFQTMLIVFEIPTNRMSNLPEYHRYLNKGGNLEELIKHIIEVYKIIFNKFDKDFASITSSRDKKYETKSLTRLQILSFFASVWQVSYTLELEDSSNDMKINPLPSRKRDTQNISKNIISHTFYDVVRSYWSGTGDRKLMDIYINSNNKYMKGIDKEIFKLELLRWNDEVSSKKSINIQSDVKMILTYVANYNSEFYQSLHDNLDYEHIFARKKYNKHKHNGIIPAGAIGNIMLLDENRNRKKKESYLYEILDTEKINIEGSLENNYIKYSFYPEKNILDRIEVEIVKNEYGSLRKMINNRGMEIIEYLTEIIYE